MVKHFAFERFNMKQYRWYTMVTYSFSHFSFFNYRKKNIILVFDMVTLLFVGNAIKAQFGNKYIWMLYLMGALGGSLCMNIFMPYNSIIIPQVGADSAVSAFLTFYGLLYPQSTILVFVFPVKFWVLLSLMGLYSFVADPTKKNCGGMIAGLFVFQMMRMRFI